MVFVRKRERERERTDPGREYMRESESQRELNHSAVANTNTRRERDGKLTGAFYIETK